MMNTDIIKPIIPLLLSAGMLVACGSAEAPKHDDQHGAHGDAPVDEEQKGPNGGKLLTDGSFGLEVTIFEAGQDPQFRLYAYEGGKPVAPTAVDAMVTLSRLDGEVNMFPFAAEGAYLSGSGVVTEPHSFDVEVTAKYRGRNYSWKYDSYEGRTTISDMMAEKVGIETSVAGPAEIEETLDILGQVEFAPKAEATLRARFPGEVKEVFKAEGESVKKGDLLARIESNESLQVYDLRSPMDGVVVNSHTRVGDVVYDSPLFIIGDLTNLWADFHIYPGDMGKVKPGQDVRIEPIGGGIVADIKLDEYLPATETDSQTLTIHAPFRNPAKTWLPGMKIKGAVTISKTTVPLAVRTEAIQRFRDFDVVFAKVGETYEVRMLELGCRNGEWTEVLGGLKPGQPYVTKNSFTIRADIEKSGASHDH